MKYILILVCMLLFGCTQPSNTTTINPTVNNMFIYDAIIIEYDSCEYVLIQGGSRGYMAHKGNCKYCKERNK